MTQTNAVRNQAILITAGPSASEAFKEAVTATSAQISVLQKKIDGMELTVADKAQMQKIGSLRDAVIDLRTKARKIKAEGNEEEAIKMMNAQYLPAMTSYIDSQLEFVKMQKERSIEVQAVTEARRKANTYAILAGLAVIVVVIFLGTAWFARFASPWTKPMSWLRA